MAKGNYLKKCHLRRILLLAASLGLILSLSVGGILAWLTTQTEPITNTFTPSAVTTEITEVRDGSSKKNVQIKNTGDTTAWIRAAVIVTWQNEAGEVYGKAPACGIDYTGWTPGTDWVQGDDGFFYYRKPVAPGTATPNALIGEIAPLADAPANGYYLTVEIIGAGIQYKPEAAFAAWAPGSGIKWSESALTKEGA